MNTLCREKFEGISLGDVIDYPPTASLFERVKEGDVEECNNYEELRELVGTYYPWNTKTIVNVVETGHLPVVQWLKMHGCPWDESACSAAASRGHLHILKWLRERGCPWDESARYCALEGGHTETLQWAIENGCP